MNADRRHTYTARALCLECDWTDDAAGAQGRAAQHHDRHRHAVRVETTITYTVPPVVQEAELELYPADPDPAQEALL
jgi:hypothetical protein